MYMLWYDLLVIYMYMLWYDLLVIYMYMLWYDCDNIMYMLWYDLLIQSSVIPLFPIPCRLGMANELSLYIWCCGCDGSAGRSPLVLSAQEHREKACARGNIPRQLWPLCPLLLLQDPIYSVICTSHYNLLERWKEVHCTSCLPRYSSLCVLTHALGDHDRTQCKL